MTGPLGVLRHSLRSLRRRPGFALAAIAVLALGVGANAAVFRMVNAVLLRPLPFHDEARLVRIYLVPAAGTPRISLRPDSFLAIRERAVGFAGMVAQRLTPMSLRGERGAERARVLAVSAGWADLLGVRPALGRTFSAEEERAGEGSGVVLMSDGVWRRAFGADPRIIGRSVVLDGAPRTVVGVMPRSFNYPYRADFWMPLHVGGPQSGPWGLNVHARLAPGTALEAARSGLAALSPELQAALPDLHRGMTVIAVPVRQTLLEGYDRVLAALLAAVGFLAALVASNLAGLLLVRLEERGREFALRSALGAGAARIFAAFLGESAVIVAAGGALGLAGAAVAGPWLQALVPQAMSDVLTGSPIDGRVAAFTLVLALVVALLVAVPAAWAAARRDPAAGLQLGARPVGSGGPRRWRAQRLLTSGQVALALALSIAAGALLGDVARRLDAGAGYPEPERLQTFTLSLSGPAYGGEAARRAAVDAVLERLRALPGVESAGATTTFPFAGGNQLSHLEVEGVSDPEGERRLANLRLVSPGFFAALRFAPLRGRLVELRDGAAAAPIAVVNESLARRAFGSSDSVGRRLRDRRDPNSRWLEVVGIVPDVREEYDVAETWYLPYAQHAEARAATLMTVVVRGGGTIAEPVLRAAVAEIDADLAVADFATADELLVESIGGTRTASRFALFFAVFGLVLAALGLYGSVARAVAGRRREIGLRLALGAEPNAVVRLFLRQGLSTATAGALGGVLLGALGGRWLLARAGTGSATGVEIEWLALATAAAAAVTIAATLLPALRALRVAPNAALRDDG